MDLLHFYLAFPIDDHTGEPLSDAAVTARHYARLVQLQRLLFRHHPALRDLALANCGTLQRREVLKPALLALPEEELRMLAGRQLRCVRHILHAALPGACESECLPGTDAGMAWHIPMTARVVA